MLKFQILEMSAGSELDKLCAKLVFGSTLTKGFHKYSTNIEHAWFVYEHLRASGEWCCLDLHSDHHYVWKFLLKNELDHMNDTCSILATATTAPEAIVKGAILAKIL
jgi:hypothetical protein